MVGIGTFCHEFSHVLGLPDLYSTDYYVPSFTPDSWILMDRGPYNNNGKTPPYYSIYERYALGWITPQEIGKPADIKLDNISKNVGYIIKTDNENEYFLLENRQQEGWDKYIPGHGMLIWHIDYNQEVWDLNAVNNIPSHQYVDIEEADAIQTDETRAGDTFPGTSNVTSFTDDTNPSMKTWKGNGLNKPITDIEEKDGIIRFKISGGDDTSIMNTWAANDITVNVEDSKLIVTSNNPEKLPLYIMDIQGHILDKSEITAGTYSFPISDRGTYIVRIGENVYKVIR